MGQIHNPTDEWMACTLLNNESKICVSPIPPRSTRPLPANTTTPQIVQETILSEDVVAKYATSNASVSSSIVVEALQLKIMGAWQGDARVNGREFKVNEAQVCIKEKDVSGWFRDNSVVYCFVGNLNVLSRGIVLTCYSSAFTRFTEIKGRLQVSGSKYVMTCQGSDFSMNLSASGDTFVDIEENPVIGGNYVGFYQRGSNSFDMHLTLSATKNGLVSGKGTEDHKQLQLLGMVGENSRFFFARIKGTDITYFEGMATLQEQVFFDGQWHSGCQEGGISLIRVME